jgi:signal transduction histidine kinase/CheY-like chemotaxis protein
MYIRIREMLIIIFTALLIIAFSVLSGVTYVRNRIKNSQEADLMLLSDIADHFISTDIALLKLKTTIIAHDIAASGEEKWPQLLASQEAIHPEFVGAAVLDAESGLFLLSGLLPTYAVLMDDPFIKQAFQGKTVITSAIPSIEGEVVFCLAAPLPGYQSGIVVTALNRMYFAKRVSSFVIWDNGHIFIDDADGNILANTLAREAWIQNKQNFVRLSQNNEQFKSIASVIQRGINRETGVGYFTLTGDNICAFRPISGSEEGWFLGVVGHLPESPFRNIDMGLIVVGIVGFFLSAIASIIAYVFIKKAFKEVAFLKETAESNSRAKSDFLANISHEMRTPMNVIVGLTDLLLEEEKPINTDETLKKINTASVTLMGIINDVLDISKIEAGKQDLNLVQYEVPSLLNDIITLNIMRIEEKPITLKLDISENLPHSLIGDDLRVKQIFNNLLSNAFKYTEEGSVTLGVSVYSGDTPHSPLPTPHSLPIWLSFYISDTGIGIRKEDIAKLFTDYNQVDTKANRKIEGTGLGLSIAKSLVEMMEGEISVESEYGKGTTFRVRIRQGFVTDTPIGKVTVENLRSFRYADKKKLAHEKLPKPDLSYAKVLVVDDFAANLDVAAGRLRKYKMQGDCVTSGQEAINRIATGEPVYDAIFMDHMMPGMDGIETTKRIRAMDTTYAVNIPIIALTANAVAGSEAMFLDNGFNAYLPEPFNVKALDAVIQKWIKK